MRKVSKIIVYYDDGTFEEVNPVGTLFPSRPYTVSPQPYKIEEGEFPFDVSKQPKWTASDKRCEKCGLEMKGPMGYVCTNYPCPSGFGGAWCNNGNQ
jgi:hypothetical protein